VNPVGCYLRDGSGAPVLPLDLEYVRVNLASKPPFTEEAFAALYRDWLTKRGEMPIPDEDESTEKAKANFSGKIIRDAIRNVRHKATPDLKRGPKGPRARQN
jgi:hypothetical protein